MKIIVPFLIFIVIIFFGFIAVLFYDFHGASYVYHSKPEARFWEFQSIDTMKYSRDLSREKSNDEEFGKTIDFQVKNIADAGATHVAIGTPYDEEFLPMLKKWIAAARRHNLRVWFRGNWSGWDNWFDYPAISSAEHIAKTRNFILNNGDLFEDGDMFSSCPECENGGPGDPRSTGDVAGFRNFLIEEYKMTMSAFKAIGKKVGSNYFSMNGDVARLIMDKKTTAALGGVVTIDHYIKDAAKLEKDIEEIARLSGGKIVLGEFGVSIPDIHGEMSEEEKEEWMKKALNVLSESGVILGINYWVNVGGSTELWDKNGKSNSTLKVLKSFYMPEVVYGVVVNELDNPVSGAKIFYGDKFIYSDQEGYFEMVYAPGFASSFKILEPAYIEKNIPISGREMLINEIMIKNSNDIIFNFKKNLRDILKR